MGLLQGCDHASWISISKQDKYSSSLPALLTSHSKSPAVHSLLMISICRLLHFLAVPLSLALSLSSPHSSFLSSNHFIYFFAPYLLARLQLLHISRHQAAFLPPDDGVVNDCLDSDTISGYETRPVNS